MSDASPAVSPDDPPLVADQSAVAALLTDPATHGGAAVTRIDTHGAMVFLAGGRAYKVKRAVRYSDMNFSSLALRQLACTREVILNRRTAPELNLGVMPILRGADGALRLGPLLQPDDPQAGANGAGVEPVEWAVVLRRFEQDQLLDRVAARGDLDGPLLTALADSVRRFHDSTPRAAGGHGGAQAMRTVLGDNLAEMAEHPELFPPTALKRLAGKSRAALAAVAPLLDRRLAAGLVRHCHGDLHLGNLVLLDGRPSLFDAIEFNDDIACIDVLYDLAFLIMDLDQRGLRPEANAVFNRYLRRDEALNGLAALPLFLSLRAAIRAKVAAAAAASQTSAAARGAKCEESTRYFAAARTYLNPAGPRLLAVGGLSGSGKSTLARSLAPEVGAVPGALHLRSDVQRKVLYEVDDLTRLPEAAYTPEVSARVYQTLLQRAEAALAAGHSVVLDAVYDRPDSRAAVTALAERAAVPFRGFWLDAPAEVLLARTAARAGDASDATPEVVRRQLAAAQGGSDWLCLAADAPPAEVLRQALGVLEAG